MVCHGKEPHVDLPVFPTTDAVNRGPHIVVDAALRDTAEDPEPVPMGIKQHLMGLQQRSVAIYRLAFGQPRQDDLLALLDKARDTLSDKELGELQINLRPSAVSSAAPEMGLEHSEALRGDSKNVDQVLTRN